MRNLTSIVLSVFLSVNCAESTPHLNSDVANSPELINSHFHSAYLGMNDASYRTDVIAEMDQFNFTKSVLHINEPSDLEDWVDAAPGRFLAGPAFPCWKTESGEPASCDWDGTDWPDLDWMRSNYESGRMKVMGEMLFVYAGVAPDDPRMAPYWALAEEMNIPVAVHINRGPPPDSPSRPTGCCPDYDADLGNPALLRPVLEEYPGLKIWLQHAGFPALSMLDDIDYLDETYALLKDYPNVFVDMTALNAAIPAPIHETAVRQFVERGFEDRIMLGTDNWEAGPIIERYASFEFLSDEQRRAIFHDNAARFFDIE